LDSALIADLLGHVFYFSIALGVLSLAYKRRIGWILRFFGEIGWCFIGIWMGMTSIWFWCIVFCIIDVKGYLKWRKSGPE
jgi:hypothetical protein